MAEAQPEPEPEDDCAGEEERREIRKIRKKLRQIEKLERLNRNLNEEEESKLTKKYELRELLSRLATEIQLKGVEGSMNDSASTLNESGLTHNSLKALNNSLSSESPEEKDQMNTSNEHNHSIAHSNLSSVGVVTTPPSQPNIDTVSRRHKVAYNDDAGPMAERGSEAGSIWLDSSAMVTPLNGHNDVVCAVDASGDILMTGSRDTTIKIWNLSNFTEQRSLGGHTSAVTCVKILPEKEDFPSLLSQEEQNNCCFGISGSLDCYIIFWNLETGQMIQKVYTYSSIQCFEYHKKLVYTGSDGGKIGVWRLPEGDNMATLSKSGCGITCMSLKGAWLYCGRTRGTIEVWNIESRDLQFQWNALSIKGVESYNEEEEEEETSTVSYSRCVRCICYYGNKIYWGDDGTNLKMLEWTQGREDDVVMKKLTNHVHEFGSTGSVTVSEGKGVLLSAGYDLDTGHSMINIRRLQDGQEEYVCTIQDGCTSYVSCMCLVKEKGEGGRVRIVTGGSELQIMDIYPNHSKPKPKKSLSQRVTPCQQMDQLTRSYSTDEDSDGSLTQLEDEEEENPLSMLHIRPLPQAKSSEGVVTANQQSWIWWLYGKCNIL